MSGPAAALHEVTDRTADSARGRGGAASAPGPDAPIRSGTATTAATGLRPSALYAQGVAAGRWQDDPGQRAALVEFDRMHDALLAPQPGWFARWRQRRNGGAGGIRGLYLWGPVGRGKTMLMDQFVASLPAGIARRVHFHHQMLEVHAALRELGDVQDPLPRIAADIASRIRVLCLDEFLVKDIGDAMILYGLLQALFDQGVALVTTSNTPPVELYKNGLQRVRFLPAIALLEQRCQVLELASPHDWRLRALTRAPVYLTPDNAHAEAALARLYSELARDGDRAGATLTINGRPLEARRVSTQAAWFDFANLCDGPYGSADYIALAETWSTLLISHVPQFSPINEDVAQRFVHLIDEVYDRRVKLALTAQVPAVELYDGQRLRGDFARTSSRLIEMQTREYLAEPHRLDAAEA